MRSPASALASLRISSGTMLSVIWRLGLPTRAARSFCAAIAGWIGLLTELQRGVEVRFGDFLGRAFIHHHVRLVADIDQVQIALEHLAVRGVGDELAADAPDANRPDRAGPRDVAEHQRRRGADDRQHIRVVLAIGAQHDALDLDFVIHALGKERPDRPVNEP